MKSTAVLLVALLVFLPLLSLFSFESAAVSPEYSVSSAYAASPFYTNLLNVTLTGDMRKDIVAVAQSQLGYHEGNKLADIGGQNSSGSGNYTEYHNYMNYPNGSGGWCGMFISFCAEMAGIPGSIIHQTTTAKPGTSGYGFYFFGDKKLPGAEFAGYYDLAVKGGSYFPKPGDIIFFSSSNSRSNPQGVNYKHVGLVQSCTSIYDDNGNLTQMTIVTIEGNTTNQVKNMTYKITADHSGWIYSGTYIGGFGIPAYTTSENPEVFSHYDIGSYGGNTLGINRQNNKEDVILLQLSLNIAAFASSSDGTTVSAPEITGIFDEATETAVRQYQTMMRLEVDGLVGPASWSSLRSHVYKVTEETEGDFLIKNRKILLYKGTGGDVALPDNCTEILPYAFYGAQNIKTMSVPESYRIIADHAFAGVTIQNVNYLATKEEFDSLTVGIGNDSFLSAGLTVKPSFITVTFSTKDGLYDTVLPVGELPVYPFDIAPLVTDGVVNYFLSWDKPLLPATEDIVYTAEYFSIPDAPLILSGEDLTAIAGASFELPVYVSFASDCYEGISYFSARLDYSAYADFLSFEGCDTSTFRITDEQGVLTILSETGAETSGQLFTLSFHLSDGVDLPESFSLTLSVDEENGDSISFTQDGFTQYPYQIIECITSNISVSQSKQYDYNGDGILSIGDVTELLNILGQGGLRPATDGSTLTIEDVTYLLNILSRL